MNPNLYLILAIVVIALVTFFTRAVPFLLFGNRELPAVMKYLGDVLPPAIMIILVCYCLRNVNFLHISESFADLAACLIVAVVHIWKRNMYVSIIIGTICYMLLIRI